MRQFALASIGEGCLKQCLRRWLACGAGGLAPKPACKEQATPRPRFSQWCLSAHGSVGRPLVVALGVQQLRFDEGHVGGLQAVAFGRVQLAGLGQPPPRLVGLAEQTKRSAVATQRAGMLGAHTQLGEGVRQP